MWMGFMSYVNTASGISGKMGLFTILAAFAVSVKLSTLFKFFYSCWIATSGNPHPNVHTTPCANACSWHNAVKSFI
jgi:hypothetical protein